MVLALVGVFALTLAGWWISRSTGIGRQLGATMVVLLLGFLVTNAIGWQPQAAAAAWVTGPLTSLAITQLLLAVDLRRILPEAQRLFAPFLVAVVSTLSAVLLGALLLMLTVQAVETELVVEGIDPGVIRDCSSTRKMSMCVGGAGG